MANELNLAHGTSGVATLIAKIFDHAWVQLGADVALAEIGGSGLYTGSVPAATLASQEYEVLFYNTAPAESLIGQGTLLWDQQGDKEVRDEVAVLERWKDIGLDPDDPKTITELVEGLEYDESATGIDKEVRKVGGVTTISRV